MAGERFLDEVEAPLTAERLERVIAITAYAMVRHNLPQILPTLKRLEAERDRLLHEGDPLDYAQRVLDRIAKQQGSG
jgi:hypothetical protein